MLALQVAITGGVASGKTTVATAFRQLGAQVVDADSIAKDLLDTPSVQQKLVQMLGHDVLDKENRIDRQWLADRIFAEPALRLRVESWVHPLVLESLARLAASTPQETLFVAEVPLLYEANAEDLFDVVVCVDAPVERSRMRWEAAGRDGAALDRREAAQLSRAEKAKRADYLLHNAGTEEELRDAATSLFHVLQRRCQQGKHA